ncbi:MAG TPA: hypothetical protein VGK45_13860 [Thermoanaerobaculia bacterium]
MSKAQRKPATLGIKADESEERPSPEQQERYRQVVSLLRQWRETDQGEDDGWSLVEEELKDLRVQFGHR